MEYVAKSFFVRISPTKLMDIARILKGRKVGEGRDLLRFIPRKSARLIGRTLGSAIANAENNFSVAIEDLRIENVLIEEGSRLKRQIPASRGSAHPILKRTSHIKVILKGIRN